jgi:hypothetical protein
MGRHLFAQNILDRSSPFVFGGVYFCQKVDIRLAVFFLLFINTGKIRFKSSGIFNDFNRKVDLNDKT